MYKLTPYAYTVIKPLTTDRRPTMFSTDPRDALLVAHAHGRHLREEMASNHQRGSAEATRRALAATLRRVANRLDPTPLVQRAA